MNKKVLIISSSPRKGGNSETLAAAFAKGAREAGHQVETVYLREKQVGFCKGCLACLKLGHCVIQDDAVEIAAKISACSGGRGRTGNLCGYRESRAGLGRLLPPLCAGWHSVCRRRKRRGRDRRSCRTGASLSDGQGGVSHGS